MNRMLWNITLFAIVFLVIIAVLVWNIVLVGRTSTTSERNLSLVQECVMDGMQADAHENPVYAAISTQRAISRLETLSTLVGGNQNLAKTTHVDIDKLHGLLTQQMRQIYDFLPNNEKQPLLDLETN